VIGLGHYLAFLGISLLVICTPGQDTALTIRNTLLGGRPAGAATALGVSAGQATWTVATSAGLAVILVASGPLLLAIRLAGAAYLVYLGVRSLASAIMRRDPAGHSTAQPVRRLSAKAAFVQGCLSNLSNAKMVAFFISLLPPFAGPHPSFVLLLVLGLNFSLLTLAWLVGYAFAVDRVGDWLRRSAIRRALDGILGAVLVALGVKVSTEALAA
jgi:threonine/homoserine/homoserine lactone efflux protein